MKLKAWSASEKAHMDDDVKQEAPAQTTSGSKMYAAYSECQRVIEQQQSRLGVASTDEHLLALTNHQTVLLVCLRHLFFTYYMAHRKR